MWLRKSLVKFKTGAVIIFPLLLATILLACMHQPSYPSTFPTNIQIGTWDWRNVEALDWTQVETEFKQLQQENFHQIYLDISTAIDYAELPDKSVRNDKIAQLTQSIQHYLQLASEHGLTVQALSGSAIGGNSSHRYIYDLLIDFIVSFNRQSPQAKFVGLQLNIEPYNQPGYAENRREILTDYFDTVHAVLEKIKTVGLTENFAVGFTVPFWFDGSNPSETPINWQGDEDYPVKILLNELNKYPNTYLAILAYRNSSNGNDGSIKLVATELEYAKAHNLQVQILVGQETSQVEPAKITFWGHSAGEVRYAAATIADELRIYPNFSGIAIHHLSSYLQLSN
jgi:hypothetical protein